MQKRDNLIYGVLPTSVYKSHEADYLRRRAETPEAKRVSAKYIYIGPNRDGQMETFKYTIEKKGNGAGYRAKPLYKKAIKNGKRRAQTPNLKDYIDALGPEAGPIAFESEQDNLAKLYQNRKEFQQIDHVVPIDKGGFTISTLMVPLAAKLNLDKADFLPTGLQGEIYEELGFVPGDMQETIRRQQNPSTAERRYQIAEALGIAAQHQADYNFTNGLEAFLNNVARNGAKTGARIARNIVPGVGTAMAAQDTANYAQEFMEDPNLMNGAQTLLNGVSTVANGIGDAALSSVVGAPVAAIAEKVAAGAEAGNGLLQMIEDTFSGQDEEQIASEAPTSLSS